MFGQSWQLVGHVGQVEEPGQYFCGALPPWRYVVARGDDGQLRAFHNVSTGEQSSRQRGRRLGRQLIGVPCRKLVGLDTVTEVAHAAA